MYSRFQTLMKARSGNRMHWRWVSQAKIPAPRNYLPFVRSSNILFNLAAKRDVRNRLKYRGSVSYPGRTPTLVYDRVSPCRLRRDTTISGYKRRLLKHHCTRSPFSLSGIVRMQNSQTSTCEGLRLECFLFRLITAMDNNRHSQRRKKKGALGVTRC